MNQILHILKKDLWRYKWAFLALIGFAGIDIYLRGTTAGLMGTPLNLALSLMNSSVSTILFLVIVVLVVQEETLVDSDADWISRPVGRSKLLISKLISLFLLLCITQIKETALLLITLHEEKPLCKSLKISNKRREKC